MPALARFLRDTAMFKLTENLIANSTHKLCSKLAPDLHIVYIHTLREEIFARIFSDISRELIFANWATIRILREFS